MENEVIVTLSALTVRYGLNVLGAILILIVGWIVSGWAAAVVRRLGARSPRFDKTIVVVLARIVRTTVLALTLIAVLNRFGVQTTSIVALLGAAGLAVGLALQGTLSNVASGVMLLGLRPFRIGDVVDVGGTLGVVDDIGLFTTQMHTPDNIAIHMPNSHIWGKEIKNLSQNPTRRIDLIFGIAYHDDIGRALALIGEVIAADERILADPAPMIAVDSLADSSVNLMARPWVQRVDFLTVKTDLLRRVKERFDAEGITIPFPQRDVHVVRDPEGALGQQQAAD